MRVAVRFGIDTLRRRRRRGYVGVWLPSPIETEPFADAATADSDVANDYELRESVSFAFLLALEALPPRARAALLLRDVLDYSAREVAQVLDTSEGNARILHLRARRALQRYDRDRRPPTQVLSDETRRALSEHAEQVRESGPHRAVAGDDDVVLGVAHGVFDRPEGQPRV